MKRQTIVMLHDVRSAHNVGSIFRTADAAGVSGVVLSGYTPTPVDRFGRERRDIAKAALGAQESVPHHHTEDILKTIQAYRKKGFRIIAVEQHKQSVSYREYEAPEKCVFIFGNEVEGLPHSVIAKSDAVVEIPLHGTKESLNVSVAAGVILFHFC
jgi:tRNA G18 (ribose-2'-O)-methylase SpoU